MENPLVSVVVICYNHEKYIRDCLDGILMQQVSFPMEIIVGDDCSTDGSLSIIREYEHRYPDMIRVIIPECNQFAKGFSLFYTRLCPSARGRYVAMCEGDDYWIDPHKLQRQFDFMETHPDYSMCFHRHKIVNGSQEYFNHFTPAGECDVALSDMVNLCICQTASVFERRQVLDTPALQSYHRDPEHGYGDICNFMACAISGKVRYMTGCWSVYRRHDDSMTARDDAALESRQKHIGGLHALIRHYGKRYRFILNNFRSLSFLGKSCDMISHHRYLSGICYKIIALALSPCFVTRLYRNRIRQIMARC